MDAKIVVKKPSEAVFGKNPIERTVKELLDYGVVNIDKPKGPTTHQVADFVKKILKIKKCGHSGSLDPGVTGLVAIGLGKSTKVVNYLLKAGKEYVCVMHIHKEVEEKKIRDVINTFIGKIEQLPPVKSAVKRARRTKKIYYIEILEIDGQDILFKVGCEAGTYIRKLCHDIGLKLKVGAHMAELRRTKVGPFDETTAVNLYDLKDAFVFWEENGDEKVLKKIIQPMENAVAHLPKIWVHDSAISPVCHGATLKVPGVSKLNDLIQPEQLVAIMTLKGELIATGISLMSSKQMMELERGVAVKLERVFMEINPQ